VAIRHDGKQKNNNYKKEKQMKRISALFIGVLLLLLVVTAFIFAQTDSTAVVTQAQEATGSVAVAIFASFIFGMFVHFVVHIKNVVGGWSFSAIIKNIPSNFSSWFINDFHKTLIVGALGLVGTTLVQYTKWLVFLNIDVNFTSISIGLLVVSALAGFVGDSAFNGGTITDVTA
jgi:uncharacterized integral membrane protein